MNEVELQSQYRNYMLDLVRNENLECHSRLLLHLDTVDFTFIVDRDDNRAADGIDLRYRFGYDRGIDSRMIASCIDVRPCTVLEMMISLSVRMEEHIMDNPDMGNRTPVWFWKMIESLGLMQMTNDYYDENYVSWVISRFLNRQYASNGAGGLFTIKNCPHDIRTTEIWYQMSWYLNEYLADERR